MDERAVLEAMLLRQPAEVDSRVKAQIEHGPIDPRDALPPGRLAVLLDADVDRRETGWCNMPDGTGYAAVRTNMPEVTGDMLDWWFEWHPHDPLRYRVWYPEAHFGITFDPPPAAGAKPYWGSVHHPIEDIGLGSQHLRIAFCDPTAFGFPADALEQQQSATIICALVGDDRKRAWHTRICHVALRSPGGIVLRSRFWIGAELRLYWQMPPFSLVNRLLASPALRRRLIPRRAPLAMASHCAVEYANLAALLPQLHSQFATAD